MGKYLDIGTCASCLRNQSDAKSVVGSKDRLILLVFVVATFSLLISVVVLLVQVTAATSDNVVSELKLKYQLLEERLDRLQSLCNKHERQEVKDVLKINRAQEQDTATNTHKQVVIDSSHNSTSLVDISAGTDSTSSRKYRVKRRSNRDRTKRKKKCKKQKELTFIQIEGHGTQEMLQNKNVVTGFWSLPDWLTSGSRKHKPASKIFKMDKINDTGKIRILKTGLYLIYAQFTLVGNPTTGFHVSIIHESKAPEKLLQCSRYSNTPDQHNTQSCFTMGIVKLKANEEIFIQENPNNTGANYSKLSYFGLIKLSDIK